MEFQPSNQAFLPHSPPCSNENIFTSFFFAMLLLILKYMACKLLTDTTIKTINNNYPCQVPLDKERGTLHPLTALQ